MENIKNNYTNFILTVIAVAMIGILLKGELNTPANASWIHIEDLVLEEVVPKLNEIISLLNNMKS